MCRFVHWVSAAALLLCLAACASVPPSTPVVTLGQDDITVAGQRVHTVEQMLAVLAENNIAQLALRTEPGVSYERIGKVIYAIFRADRTVTEVVYCAAP